MTDFFMMYGMQLKRFLIVAFCLWHMFAIAVYVMPNEVPNMSSAKNAVRGYVLLLSQWQWWDIFSPDPHRRPTFARIEVFDGSWKLLKDLSPESLPEYRRAKELKLLGRMEDEGYNALLGPYLTYECKAMALKEGTALRMVTQSYVLPKNLDTLKIFGGPPEELEDRMLMQISCPAVS